MYTVGDSVHANGKISDVIYAPIIENNADIPPVIIEVQNKVDANFMSRAISYCTSVYQQYKVYPVFLVISINDFNSDLFSTKFQKPQNSFFFEVKSEFWAKRCLVLSKKSISDFVHDTPMQSLVALALFLASQKRCILSLEGKWKDDTLRMLYKIAKEKMENEIEQEEKNNSTVIDICSKMQKQFERILSSATSGNNNRVVQYAEDGIEFSKRQKRKYERAFEESVTPICDTDIENIPTDKDMEYVEGFRKHKGKDMKWKDCFIEGQTQGFLQGFKNASSLKSTYYQKKRIERQSK
jgi:hypothetical protein